MAAISWKRLADASDGWAVILIVLMVELPLSFETPRLLVRAYRTGDSAWYWRVGQRNREHLARHEADNPIRTLASEDEAKALLESFSTAWQEGRAFFLGAFLKSTDSFVAQLYVGLHNPGVPEYSIGYFGDEAQGGRGYVTEMVTVGLTLCFEHLGAHRVRLECDDLNTRSLGVAERCGFVLEGRIRENHRHADGTLSGTLHYGLLRSEWAARRA